MANVFDQFDAPVTQAPPGILAAVPEGRPGGGNAFDQFDAVQPAPPAPYAPIPSPIPIADEGRPVLAPAERIVAGLEHAGRAVRAGAKMGAAGTYKLGENALMLLRLMDERLSPDTAPGAAAAAGAAERWLSDAAARVAPEADEIDDDVIAKIYQGLGSAPYAIGQYGIAGKAVGPVAGFASVDALAAADRGMWETFVAALKGGILGKIFVGAGPLKRAEKATVLGAAGGTMALAEGGDVSDVVAGATTLAILGGMSGAGRVGARQAVRNVFDQFDAPVQRPRIEPPPLRGAAPEAALEPEVEPRPPWETPRVGEEPIAPEPKPVSEPQPPIEGWEKAVPKATDFVRRKDGGKVTPRMLMARFGLDEAQAQRLHGHLRSQGILTQKGYARRKITKPRDVLDIIKEMGGIKPDGELRAMDLARVRPGTLRKNGRSVSDVREHLEELGMVPRDSYDNVVYDEIGRAIRKEEGRPFHPQDEHLVRDLADQEAVARNAEMLEDAIVDVQDTAKAAGWRMTEAETRDAAKAMLVETRTAEQAIGDVADRAAAAFIADKSPDISYKDLGIETEVARDPQDYGLPEGTERAEAAFPRQELVAGRPERGPAPPAEPPTEKTDQGDQYLGLGVKPVADRDRLEVGARKPLKSEKMQKAPDEGLFDVAGRGQLDLVELARKPALEVELAPKEPAPAPAKPEVSVSESNVAKNLRGAAARIEARADEILGQDRMTNTARRARMAAGAVERGEHEKAIAKTAARIADLIDAGEAGALSQVKTIADVRELEFALKRAMRTAEKDWTYAEQRKQEGRPPDESDFKVATMPRVTVHGRALKEILAEAKGARGLGDSLTVVRRIMNRVGDFGPVDSAKEIAALKAVATVADKKGEWSAKGILEQTRKLDRLAKIGIGSKAVMRIALRAYAEVRSEKAKPDPIKEAERKLIGSRIPGFFQTPKALAERMVEDADIEPGMDVLEPSAGAGRLADAMVAKVEKDAITVIEPQSSLREILGLKGYTVAESNFMEHTGQYDRIVMNPPFEKGQDAEHVRHAYDQLKPGGKLVAIMSPGPFQRGAKKDVAFREWFEGVDATEEALPAGTFKESGTGAGSRLVVIDKPEARKPATPQVAALPGLTPLGVTIAADKRVRAAEAAKLGKEAPLFPGAPSKEPPLLPGFMSIMEAEALKVTAEKVVSGRQKFWNTVEEKHLGFYGALGRLPAQKRYLVKRYLALGKMAKVDEIGKRIYKVFRQATDADSEAIYDYLTHQDAKPEIIADKRLRAAARQVKQMIDKVGDQLVERGLLDAEAHEAFRGAYLPRVYLKYLLPENLRTGGTGPKTSDQGYRKARKQIPKEVRELVLGEITDPAFLASRGYIQQSRDIAVLDFLEEVSREKEWVFPENMIEFEGRKVTAQHLMSEARRIRKTIDYYKPDLRGRALEKARAMEDAAQPVLDVAPDDPGMFRQVPDIGRYGSLRGMWVRKEIYNDVVGGMNSMPPGASIAERLLGQGGFFTKATNLWKLSKVALNPPTQVRNFVSNGILLDLSGVPFHRLPDLYVRALNEMLNDGKHWKIAKKYGVAKTTFASQEMYRMREDLLRLEKGVHPARWLREAAVIVANRASDVYGLSEAWGKTVKIMDAMKRERLSEADAALAAHKALFDYSLVPASVRYLRSAPIGVPFLTFQYKVLPRLLEAAAVRPTKYIKYALIGPVLSAMIANDYDVTMDDVKSLREALPTWLRERGNAFVLPFKDADGDWQALNIGYFFPWGMYQEVAGELASGKPGRALKTTGTVGSPLANLIAAVSTNKDPFTERDITRKGDPPARQVADIMNYLWRMAAPTWLTDIGAVNRMQQAISGDVDRYGDPRLTIGQAGGRFVGVNIYKLDPSRSRADNIRRMKRSIEDTRRQRKYATGPGTNLTREKRREINMQYNAYVADQQNEMRAYMRRSKVHPNLR